MSTAKIASVLSSVVTRKRKPPPLSHEICIDCDIFNVKERAFIASIAKQLRARRRHLSVKQAAWLERLYTRTVIVAGAER